MPSLWFSAEPEKWLWSIPAGSFHTAPQGCLFVCVLCQRSLRTSSNTDPALQPLLSSPALPHFPSFFFYPWPCSHTLITPSLLPLRAIPTSMLNTIEMSAGRIDWNNNSERCKRWLVDAKQACDGLGHPSLSQTCHVRLSSSPGRVRTPAYVGPLRAYVCVINHWPARIHSDRDRVIEAPSDHTACASASGLLSPACFLYLSHFTVNWRIKILTL